MMNAARKLLGNLILLGCVIASSGAYGAGPLPILPLDHASDRGNATDGPLGTIDNEIRDPIVAKTAIQDETEATRVIAELQQQDTELRGAKGPRIAEIQGLMFESQLALSYFFLDHGSDSDNRARLQQSRNAVIQLGRNLAKISKSDVAKARYSWHVSVAQIQSGSNRATAIKALEAALSGASKKEKLPRNLMAPTKLLIAQAKASQGGKDKANALHELANAARTMSPRPATSLLLYVARNAKRTEYRPYLASAVSRGGKLADADRKIVLGQAVSVWQRQEGGAIDWTKVPFDMTRYMDLAGTHAVLERIALSNLAHNQPDVAIKRYRALVRTYEGTPSYAPLETRLLDILQSQGTKGRTMKTYESELIAVRNKLNDAGALGQNNEGQAKAYLQAVVMRHESLGQSAFAVASKKSSTKDSIVEGLRISQNLATASSDEPKKEMWTERVAIIQAMAGNHSKAVAIYMDLALNTKEASRKPKYLTAAITSQSQLAEWPLQAPWGTGGVQGGRAPAREALLDMYAKLHEIEPQRWDLVAQMGNLDVSLGRVDVAFALWTDQLKKDPRGSHAAYATGTMMLVYNKGKQWENLESTCRIAIKANMRPTVRSTSLNSQEYLATALLEGGRTQLAAQQYQIAVKKLDEFVTNYRAHTRRDEGMILLSDSLHGAGQHERSVEVLTAVVEQYPSSKYIRAALLRGGDYSLPVAYEDATMFFYQAFMDKFERDAEGERVRDSLISLYEGREMYSRAATLLKRRMDAGHLSREIRSQAAVAWMKLEDAHSSEPRAQLVAQTILGSAMTSAEAKTLAIQTKARSLFTKRDTAGILTLQRYTDSLDQTQAEVLETSGQLRYFSAELRATSVRYDVDPLSVKDPLATLNAQYGTYWNAKTAYEAVCKVGQTSYCAPAMYKLARLSEAYVDWLQDLKIVETLDAATVKGFQDRKQSIVEGLTGLIESSDNRALALINEGSGTPEWSDEILWQNSSDWNFDRVTGNTGNGYVQFRPQLTSMRKEK